MIRKLLNSVTGGGGAKSRPSGGRPTGGPGGAGGAGGTSSKDAAIGRGVRQAITKLTKR